MEIIKSENTKKKLILTHFAAFLLYTALSVFYTYPLFFSPLDSRIPSDLGDPLLNTFIMGSIIHKFLSFNLQSLSSFFDINIFYPYKYTLAYSENLLSTSFLFALPAYLITKSFVAAYNITFLIGFLLSGFFMYILTYYLTQKILPSIFSGIIYSFAPFKFIHLGHIQIITSMWLPLIILFMHKFFEEGYLLKNIYLSSIFFLLNATANTYFMLFISIFIFLMFLIYLSKSHLFIILKGFFTFWIINSILIAFIYYPYYIVKKTMGFSRSLQDAAEFSANIKSFISVPPGNLFYGLFLPTSGGEATLFWGAIPSILVFFFFFFLKKNFISIRSNKIFLFYSLMGLLSIILAFGPFFMGKNWLPNPLYLILYYFFPGFDSIRVPARLEITILFSLGIISGFSLKLLFQNKLKLPLLLMFLLIFEYINIPIAIAEIPFNAEVPKIYSWLKAQKDQFAIAEMPLPKSYSFKDSHVEYRREFFALYHQKFLFNGWSGHFPFLYQAALNYPIEKLLLLFKEINIKYIIIHKQDFLASEELNNFLNSLTNVKNVNLKKVYSDEKSIAYKIINRNQFFSAEKTFLKDFNLSYTFKKISENSPLIYLSIKNNGKNPAILLYRNDFKIRISDHMGNSLSIIKVSYLPKDSPFILPSEAAHIESIKLLLPKGSYLAKFYQDEKQLTESFVIINGAR